MSEEIKFKCEECGNEFEPDPDTMLETHMSGECECCDASPDLQEAIEKGETFTGEQLAAMSPEELSEIGLTVEQRDELLNGETVAIGGMCICKPCQDRLAGELP